MQGWIDAEISRVGSIYVVIIHPKILLTLLHISQNSVEPAALPTFSSIFLAHDPQLNDILIWTERLTSPFGSLNSKFC